MPRRTGSAVRVVDLVAFDDDWRIQTVIARGRVMVDAGQAVVRGMFDWIILDQLG